MASFPAPPPMASPFESMARDMAPPSPRAVDSDDGASLEAKTQGPVHSSVRLGSLLPYVKPKVRDKVMQAASNKEGHLTAQDLVHVSAHDVWPRRTSACHPGQCTRKTASFLTVSIAGSAWRWGRPLQPRCTTAQALSIGCLLVCQPCFPCLSS